MKDRLKIEKPKAKSKLEYELKQKNRVIGLSCYITITEDGKPTVHDLEYGSQEFGSLTEATEFYEMLLEAYHEGQMNDELYVESDDEREYRYLFYQLEAYNQNFTGIAKRKLENAKISSKICH